METNCIEIISSLHGRQRRLERNISKVDLQAAVMYGTKTKAGKKAGEQRWKYDFGGVTYVTDSTSTTEVTSWAEQLPIDKAILNRTMKRQILEQKVRMLSMEITSHTILVVDQSGSMNRSDVRGHRSRSRALFYNVANDIIAQPLIKNQVSFTDVLTIIQMRDIGKILIREEPFSWELYNTVVDLANDERRGRGHGNFIPALDLGIAELTKYPKNAALMFFVLSDGKPSDYCITKANKKESIEKKILMQVRSICELVGNRLTFGTFGFSNDTTEFNILQRMADVAKACGCKNAFFQSGLDSIALHELLSTLSSSVTETRLLMSSINVSLLHSNKGVLPRRLGVVKEKTYQTYQGEAFLKSEWDFYDSNKNNLQRLGLVFRDGHHVFVNSDSTFLNPNAKAIAIKKHYFGEGAERVVFHMTEVDCYNNPIGIPMVVKANLFITPGGHEELEFHRIFGKTQKESSRLAYAFNTRMDMRKIPSYIPRVEFLECFYYTIDDVNGQQIGYLVEKQLEQERFKKWNNNSGGVHNIAKKDVIPLNRGTKRPLETIEEEEEEDECGSVESDGMDPEYEALLCTIIDDDVPQAFSHYTSVYTKREKLVCDIQGVLSTSTPPVFELTDPAIHSTTKQKYGKTDHGHAGRDAFFRSHKCNALCIALLGGNIAGRK